MLEQLYGLQMMPNLVMPQQQPAHSLGTGFIIREDGLIITNNHVIEGADVIKVQMTEGSEKTFEAKVIGRDSRTDIALIKVNTGSKLPYVVLGSSKDVEVGEWVTAFGNPFGHGHTMTKGIISAKGRSIDEINKFPFLQTDASINPGNSGGPLVNSKGLVIGVNTAIDPRAQNIGFAIPIDDVKTILPDLEKDGGIKKGYLGVGLADIDMNAANSLNLTSPEGSIIVNVEPHGPASKAGLKNYDVVIEFDGKKIKSSSDLMNAVADSKIGVAIPLKVIRDGKNKNLSIEIGERPSARVAHKNELPKNQMGQKDKLDIGLSVSDLTPQLREEFQIPDAIENHPIVLEIQNDSPALRSGIRPGDLILDVNRKEVKTAKEVLSSLHKGTNTIRIARGEGIRIFVLDSK
jgi:serine protease Do